MNDAEFQQLLDKILANDITTWNTKLPWPEEKDWWKERVLTKAQLILLANAINGNTSLLSLDLSRSVVNSPQNTIDDEVAIAFATMFTTNTTLKSFCIRYCHISDSAMLIIIAALAHNPSLEHLDLSTWHHHFSSRVFQELGNVLRTNNSLTSLRLSASLDSFLVRNKALKYLAQGLLHNTSLTTLDLSDNGIGNIGARKLAKLFVKNTTITHVNLAYNKIGDKSIRRLMKTLESNFRLLELDLSSNKFGIKGVSSIAHFLRQNRTLKVLALSVNRISGRKKISVFAEALAHNKSLAHLFFEYNCLTDDDGARMVKSLESNTSLKALVLESYWKRYPIFGEQTALTLAKALTVNSNLKILTMGIDALSSEACSGLIESLKRNITLIHFYDSFSSGYPFKNTITIPQNILDDFKNQLKINREINDLLLSDNAVNKAEITKKLTELLNSKENLENQVQFELPTLAKLTYKKVGELIKDATLKISNVQEMLPAELLDNIRTSDSDIIPDRYKHPRDFCISPHYYEHSRSIWRHKTMTSTQLEVVNPHAEEARKIASGYLKNETDEENPTIWRVKLG